ncbi:hypothetical protein GCM10023116_08740 [Kistimonas scapharcae]|uniref:Uncharacterized protein n=1 Tax=Kistimonas scapharcae TaxID=1036133 RepID=A0ABP8V0H4_9GAMM
MLNLNNRRRAIYFRGYTTAVSALAVNRPEDNFASTTGSKDLQRLPRLGPKTDRSPVFFPGTQLRHLIREALLVGACRASGGKLPLQDHFMLMQGVPIGELAKELSSFSMDGVVEREDGLRAKNPIIGLGGFWKFSGTLGVNDWIPESQDEPCYYIHKKMRAMPFKRNEELVRLVADNDIEKLKRIMSEDMDIARKARDIDTQIKDLKKAYATASSAEKKNIGEQISDLEATKAHIKNSKEGATETLERPVEGYEAIVPSTRMRSGIDIARANEMDLGFVLYALRHISLHPYVGGHYADGKGEFALDWTVRTWGDDLMEPVTLGTVKVSLLDFSITDHPGSTVLSDALRRAEDAFANPQKHGLDFSVFNPSAR